MRSQRDKSDFLSDSRNTRTGEGGTFLPLGTKFYSINTREKYSLIGLFASEVLVQINQLSSRNLLLHPDL